MEADLAAAFKRLKFLANNPELVFGRELFTAFMVTQYQIWGAILNEAVTIHFMTQQATILDLVMNFVAFEAIYNIDNLARTSSKNITFNKVSDVG